MPEILRQFTVTAYDDDTVEVSDVKGFAFPPIMCVTFDDYETAQLFNIGHWSLDDCAQAVGSIHKQLNSMRQHGGPSN